MRSPLGGSLATCLIFVPLVAVPLFAVLGMPPLPSSTSVSAVGDDLKFASDDSSQPPGTADLLAPVRVSGAKSDAPASREDVRTASGDADPFAEFSRDSDGKPSQKSAVTRSSARERRQRWPNEGNGLPQKTLLSTERLSDDHSAASAHGQPPADRSLENQAESGKEHDAPAKSPEARRDLPEAQAVVALDTESSQATAPNESPAARAAGPETSASSGRAMTWKRAVNRLNALGIRDFQLQAGDREGEFNFSCRMISPTNPRVIHRFEAEANDPLDAVNQVLRQIDDWRTRHGDRRNSIRTSAADAKVTSRVADSSDVDLTSKF